MLNKDVAKLLNEQINKEFYSAYLYMLVLVYKYGHEKLNNL